MKISWLPPQIPAASPDTMAACAAFLFDEDFVCHTAALDGRKIITNDAFTEWDSPRLRLRSDLLHIVTKDPKNKNFDRRFFDEFRAARVPWCRPTIEHWYAAGVYRWKQGHYTGHTREYIWLSWFDYLVVLEPKGSDESKRYYFVTAFYIDGSNNYEYYLKEYQQACASGNAITGTG